MKHHIDQYLPGALLLSYSIYCAFASLTISHSLILISLAGLYGYNQFLLRQEIKKNNQNDLDQLKYEFEDRFDKQKELMDGKIQKLENELGQISISMGVRSGSSSSPVPPKREQQKVVF